MRPYAKKHAHTGSWNLNGKLSVAEDRKHGRDARDNVRQDDCRASMFLRFETGEDEYTSTNDGANAKPHEVPPCECLLHLMLASRLHLNKLGMIR